MPSFSFFLHAASNLPLRCSEVKSGQTKTTRSDCQSPHPISCLVPATLFSYCFFTSAGDAHLQLWRMFLPEQLQPWPMRWTQFLSISSCHLCSSQGPAHQRAGLDDPVKQMDEAFPTPSPLGLLTKSHRAIVTIGGVDESFKALGCPKHYARAVHPTLLCC